MLRRRPGRACGRGPLLVGWFTAARFLDVQDAVAVNIAGLFFHDNAVLEPCHRRGV